MLFKLLLSALSSFLMGYFWLKGDDTQNPIEQIKYYAAGFLFFVLGMMNLKVVLGKGDDFEEIIQE